jgi:3-oxoacyl-[acyl-carrier protein] reductase
VTELQAKTVFITGASRGIGAAAARTFSRAGVRQFILHYNSHRSGVEALESELTSAGAKVRLLQADLSEDQGIDKLCSEVKSSGIAADILINNAGSLVQRAKLPEMTTALYDRVMNLNVKSAFFLTQAVAPAMSGKGGGQIINLSSIAARNGGGPGATVYAASKAAVAAITKGLAKELAPLGIRVNAVSPGTVDNDFHAQFSTRQMMDSVVTQTPAGKLGDNDEVADTILFLCTNPSRYIYGQTIEINGGMYMV